MSRTATPLRAIPSTLANRASLSIPPSSQTYEPLAKSVLRQRFTSRILLLSALFCWSESVFWNAWSLGARRTLGIRGVLLIPFLPSTLVATFATWLIVVVPVMTLRKVYLTATRTPANSPSSACRSAWSKVEARRASATYLVSAILAVLLHVSLAYANEQSVRGDPRLSLFVKSKKHPHYLNGRLLFLIVSQATLAGGNFLRNVMLDRFVFRWALPPSQYRFNIFELLRILIVVFICVSMSIPVACLVFGMLRLVLPVLYKFPLVHLILRPFTYHFLRGSSLFLPFYHYKLLFRAWCLGFTTLSAWEFAEALFEIYIAQPIPVSPSSADPSVTLVSGISSPDQIIKFFALLELQALASSESPSASSRRSDLFADQKYTPSLWSQCCRECLLLLGRDYQHFLRRGASPPSPPPPAAHPPAKAPIPAGVPSTPTPLVQKPIFRKEKPSPIRAVLDSFASDGTFPQAVQEGAESVHMPEIFKSVEGVVLPRLEKSKGDVRKSVDGAKGALAKITGGIQGSFESAVHKHAPAAVSDMMKNWGLWWNEVRLSKVVESCLPFRELDLLAVDVLSHLVCASLTEDRYGVVQRDIPKILEGMLSFLSAIEEYQAEMSAKITPVAPHEKLTQTELEQREALQAEIEKANDILGLVGNGLKEGVARIVRTFGDKILAFKFPPRTAKKLQGFLDYC